MNRGERVVNKTRSVIKNALLELIKEKNYPNITVSEITERGDVGRSTLYKHYKSKADIFVDIHKDMFENLFSGLSTSESWSAPEPSSELVAFMERCLKLRLNPFSLSYKLGSDIDYLMTNITAQLTATIEERLRNSYCEEDSDIPLSILALSISNLFSGLLTSWFAKYQSSDVRKFATLIHRMIRALIYEATGERSAS